MRIENGGFQEFIRVSSQKKLVAFGATVFMQVIAQNYIELLLPENVSYVVDNDPSKEGAVYELNGCEKIIYPVDHLLRDDLSNIVVLIGSDAYAMEMFQQLDGLLHEQDVPCFSLAYMIMSQIDDDCSRISLVGETRIPRIIHCFWFSEEKKDELSEKCICSWKKFCPDYEIKEWNTHNYDVTKNKYMYEAFKAKKWAYVTDYARLDILYQYGGIYFDLDLELLKNIDSLLRAKFITGFGPIRDIELAAMAAEKQSEIIYMMRNEYADREFDSTKRLTLKDVQPVFMDHFMMTHGFEINGKFQNRDGNVLLPRDAFSPRNWFTGELEVRGTSFGVHHCAGGWASRVERENRVNAMKGIVKIWGSNLNKLH